MYVKLADEVVDPKSISSTPKVQDKFDKFISEMDEQLSKYLDPEIAAYMKKIYNNILDFELSMNLLFKNEVEKKGLRYKSYYIISPILKDSNESPSIKELEKVTKVVEDFLIKKLNEKGCYVKKFSDYIESEEARKLLSSGNAFLDKFNVTNHYLAIHSSIKHCLDLLFMRQYINTTHATEKHIFNLLKDLVEYKVEYKDKQEILWDYFFDKIARVTVNLAHYIQISEEGKDPEKLTNESDIQKAPVKFLVTELMQDVNSQEASIVKNEASKTLWLSNVTGVSVYLATKFKEQKNSIIGQYILLEAMMLIQKRIEKFEHFDSYKNLFFTDSLKYIYVKQGQYIVMMKSDIVNSKKMISLEITNIYSNKKYKAYFDKPTSEISEGLLQPTHINLMATYLFTMLNVIDQLVTKQFGIELNLFPMTNEAGVEQCGAVSWPEGHDKEIQQDRIKEYRYEVFGKAGFLNMDGLQEQLNVIRKLAGEDKAEELERSLWSVVSDIKSISEIYNKKQYDECEVFEKEVSEKCNPFHSTRGEIEPEQDLTTIHPKDCGRETQRDYTKQREYEDNIGKLYEGTVTQHKGNNMGLASYKIGTDYALSDATAEDYQPSNTKVVT